VFQAHPWLTAWLDGDPVCATGKLRIGIARRDGEIVAILPLAVRRYHGVRVLEWAAQRFSDYGDGLGPPDLLATLWNKLVRHGGIDIIRLRNVAPDAAIRPVLAAGHPRLAESEDETNLRLRSRWSNGQSWLRALNKKKRSNDARGRRILSELGTVTVEQFRRNVPVEAIVELVRLKTVCLEQAGGSSALLKDGPELLVAFTQALARIDRLLVVLVRCDGEIVAGAINAIHGRSVWAYFATYNPKFQRVSPGILLMTEYTQHALDVGYDEVNYLRGSEGYKFEFATTSDRLGCFTRPVSLVGATALLAFRMQTALEARTAKRLPPDGPREELGSAYVTAKGTPRHAGAHPAPRQAAAVDAKAD